MKHRLAVVAGLVAAVLGACSSISVNWDWDPGADFSSYRTYAWMETPPEARDPRVDSSLLDTRVVQAVDHELKLRGLQHRDTGTPDLWVSWFGILDRRLEARSYPGRYRYPSREVEVREYETGTLVVDLVEAATMRQVWRASAQAYVNRSASPEQRTERIREAARKMFERYPPPR